MLKKEQLHSYQQECVTHILANNDAMLWLQMGLGKTPITLTAIAERIKSGSTKKVLIFGPLRVIQSVWTREAAKWEHTKHLRFSIMHGDRKKRLKRFFANADIYLCNYEAMNWVAEQLHHYYISRDLPIPFDMVVYDEVSCLKNSNTRRMKGGNSDRKMPNGDVKTVKVIGWRKILPHIKYRVGLTGTPASNGYLDLHGQYLAVDGGKRLGEFVSGYKDRYFKSDYMGWTSSLDDSNKSIIESRISDITIKMDAKDYLDLPAVSYTNMYVTLPAAARKAYDEVQEELFTVLDSGEEVELFSKQAVSTKCLQVANGFCYYGEEKDTANIHDAKLDALEEVLESAGGQPVLCSYSFKADADRIMKKFKKYKPVNLTAAKSSETGAIIEKWNRGEIKLIIGHPKCLAGDTEVLTEYRGWIKITEVRADEKVYDGVEFVSHRGCSYSGYKEVIDVFGVRMTPDHKLLIEDKWTEAQYVGNNRGTKRKALYKYEGVCEYLSEMFQLRNGSNNTETKRKETQQKRERQMSALCLSQHDRLSNMENMEWNETPREGFNGQGLCRQRNISMQGVGIIRNILQGYVKRISGQFDDRANRCGQGLLQKKLQMDSSFRSTSKQKNNQMVNVQGTANSSSRAVSINGSYKNNAFHQTEERNDSRRSDTGCFEDVYDLVDCGPRNRFLIRNSLGEAFISHNSMGHGIDGLQDSGSILVWFGLNWSLELVQQMNARIDRQGQKRPVSIIRILCEDTIDIAVLDAIVNKEDTQEGLKAALDRYRKGESRLRPKF